MDALASLSPRTREWFERAFGAPTPAQELAWPAIAGGGHVLVQAPTGSGKTLAAFLLGLDRLNDTPGEGMRLLYVSPLKALNYDIERNLRGPLAGIGSALSVGVRTGDTPQRDRERMLRTPPDILITTPESLYLLLTSRGRELLKTVETVILDEVHAVAGTKRGAHLSLSLERLERVAAQPFQRIGLSATQRPLAEIGRWVAGPDREIALIDAGQRKELDLEVVVPVEDMRELGASSQPLSQPVVQDGVEMDSGYEATARSIWPSIYPALLELVRAHRSTIVFVNNRRLAERLALRINELAEQEVARAHHGSLAREQRVLIEEDLKAGRIPCLVATSSLELGIDMGAVDLVAQVESPKSVARGLQRVGRAGHELGATSKGRIFPKFRADLLECAVVAKAMREGAIEETAIPRNPLDVLAQQIVAICAEEEIAVDDLHRLVRGSYPFAELAREQLENVLDMLAGRYPSDEFAELRPRIVWDRTAGVIRGRTGARRLAVTNAGTIPDRGLFGVFQVGGGGRVGELDEEMVYEAREGQTFMLGASTWRIEEITRDRVLVSPAPGVPGAVPFWKGEGVGRPYELGQRIGEASRELAALSDESAARRLREANTTSTSSRVRNLLAFLREQERSSALPTDRTVVVERFRDEIGDWRVCVLTPFGGRVHAPWAMALAARLRDSLGAEVQSLWSDDGIALHFPDADAPPSLADLFVEPQELEDLVVQEVGSTALFGARFRENAGRALLIPRRRPGQRTPLWQQRLKAQSLLEVARKYGSFPIVLETYRECLQDVFDLPALRGILRGLQTRELDLVEIETASASPMAASLLFDYVATYMYEDDTPAAERRAQALSLDRELLRELLGQEELRELIDPGALAEVEGSLMRQPRNADELHDLLRRVGDLRAGELDAGFAETLVRERRAFRARIGDADAVIAAEDAGLYRDAFGVMPPGGLPESFLEPVDDALERILLRYARSHGPFTTRDVASRYALEPAAVEALLAAPRGARPPRPRRASARRRRARVVRPGCAAADPPRIARGAAPAGRAGGAAGARPLPARPGTGSTAGRRCARRSSRCRGSRSRSRSGRRRSCPGGSPATSPPRSTSSARPGRSCGSAPASIASRCTTAKTQPCSGRPRSAEPLGGPVHDAVRAVLARSAEFWPDLVAAVGIEVADVLPVLWELVWNGEVTNDAWAPLRAKRRYGMPAAERRPRRFSRSRVSGDVATAGRWSPTGRLFAGDAASRAPDRRALAELLLERQGIVTRDGVRAEGIPGGYGAVYGELRALENVGACRRGYFVEGLGGAQFALPGAVERLRELRDADEDDALVLAAAEPAQPYGGVLPWPRRAAARAARVAGAHVVLLGGEAALYVERGGRSLLPLRDPDPEWLRPALTALVEWVRADRGRRLSVERFDGSPVVESDALPLLVEAGFLAGPRRAVLRP